MRIGVVTEYFFPTLGGITENIYHSSIALLSRGHDVRIITGRFDDPGRIDESVKSRIIFLGRSMPVFFNGSCGRCTVGFGLTNKIKRILAAYEFDVLHCHSPVFPTLPMIAAAHSRCATVCTLHTRMDGDIYYRLYRKRCDALFRQYDKRIAVSESCARDNAAFFPYPFDVIPNGVDVGWWQKGKKIPAFDDDYVNVFFIGRPDVRNGLDSLIYACAKAFATRPKARLLIVGDGPLRRYFEGLVPSEIRDRVHFVGAAHHARRDWCATADIFCFMPTVASFGITLLEGMSAAKAMIVSNIEAFRDLVKHEHSALLVKPNDINDIAASIGRLIDDRQLREKLGRNAFEGVHHYDWPKVTDRLIDCYEAAIKNYRLCEKKHAHL